MDRSRFHFPFRGILTGLIAVLLLATVYLRGDLFLEDQPNEEVAESLQVASEAAEKRKGNRDEPKRVGEISEELRKVLAEAKVRVARTSESFLGHMDFGPRKLILNADGEWFTELPNASLILALEYTRIPPIAVFYLVYQRKKIKSEDINVTAKGLFYKSERLRIPLPKVDGTYYGVLSPRAE